MNTYNWKTAVFENCELPFMTLRIDVFEAYVKAAIRPSADPKISKKQLQYAFRNMPEFKKNLEWGTPMMILCEHFKDPRTEMIDLSKIMILGVLLCTGSK